jgi:hypothetical protein
MDMHPYRGMGMPTLGHYAAPTVGVGLGLAGGVVGGEGEGF